MNWKSWKHKRKKMEEPSRILRSTKDGSDAQVATAAATASPREELHSRVLLVVSCARRGGAFVGCGSEAVMYEQSPATPSCPRLARMALFFGKKARARVG